MVNGHQYIQWSKENADIVNKEEKSKKNSGPKHIAEKLKKFGSDNRSNESLLNRRLLTSKERKKLRSRQGICPNCGEQRSHKKCRIYLNEYDSSYQKKSFIESCTTCYEEIKKDIEKLHKNGKKFKLSEIRKMITDGSIKFE